MTSHDRRQTPTSVVDGPDLAFKAGIGFYLGIVVAGVVALAAIAADASTAAVLVTTPSTVVATLLVALVFGDRLSGLPEQLGRNRRRRLLPALPAAVFATALLVPAVLPLESTPRLTIAAIALTFVTGATAVGIAQMSRNRYVDAITGDEPEVAWTWHRTTFDTGLWGMIAAGGGVLLVVSGFSSIASGNGTGVWFVGYGSLALLLWLSDRRGWDAWGLPDGEDRWGNADLEAYEAGVVVDRFEQKLVPWDRIDGVRLTEGELVLERRRWFDLRCDRSVIDDPESVHATLERLHVENG
ncbi:hypothetical protein [Natronobacterium texcoconense]|uniref:Uncharacterized protein n=1 Tax=Natronobacterium texcoconense TaxID=1095778 RepID=A0A1H0ZS11_NATTX|nr:hypothetical protein [Natronobacterium texcoconense]SDQ30285.1 hypothetical protein SAMN04489842_0412 [Natronobacterium texcoconense]